ncbi:MAG: VOC family protein [Bacteroidota bacterium]
MKIDHLIFAAPTLETGIDVIEEKLGIRPIFSGQHLGRGTHNALLALGDGVYLEVIAPDPSQDIAPPLWMKTHLATTPRLWTWAAKTNHLVRLKKIATLHNLPFGKIESGTRTQPNGEVLRWQLSLPVEENEGGIIPFFVDWAKTTTHPSKVLPQAGSIVQLKAYHPYPVSLQAQMEKLGLDLIFEKHEQMFLEVTMETLDGSYVKL